jgi:nitrous oxide reductase accessory protein NosL
MKIFFLFLSAIFILLTFIGCDKKAINTQPHEVHWDRDMCARCAMVVSDRDNTTQVINPTNGKVYMFDDIGCMILWFDNEKIPWKDKAVIWITDDKTGKWIDARKAFYDTENITPMAYGFSAHKTKDSIAKDQEIIDYNEVVKRVRAIGR